MSSDISSTGILVTFCNMSGNMLLWSGCKCWTSTYAIPENSGMAFNNFLNASKPPAEAPIPTTGKALVDLVRPARSTSKGSVGVVGILLIFGLSLLLLN